MDARTTVLFDRRDTENNAASVRQFAALLGLFLLLATLAVALKAHHEPLHLADLLRKGGAPAERGYLVDGTASLPLPLRVGGALIYVAVERVLAWLGTLFMIGPETSPLFFETPWGHKAYSAIEFEAVIAPFLAVHVYQILLLLPVLFCARLLFQRLWAQMAFLTATMLCYGGWPPLLVDTLFRFGHIFADWPRAYYMFADRLLPSDVSTLSFLLSLTLVLALSRELSYTAVAGVAALGQLTAEHLGFVAGIGIFLVSLIGSDVDKGPRFWLALRRLAIAGIVSLSVLLALLVFVAGHGSMSGEWSQHGEIIETARLYMSQKWEKYGQYNFRWFNVIAANFIALMALPMLAGTILGVATGLRSSVAANDAVVRHFAAAAAVSFAFFLTMLLGLWNSGFASDMGRQALPLACLMVLVAAKGAHLLLAHLIRRRHRASA